MQSFEFQLFRVKFVKPKQTSLFDDNKPPSEIFTAAINEKPSIELRKGFYWHIGNVEAIDENSGYFAFGRTTKSIVAKYDNETQNFIEEDSETSPYAHVIFENKIGLLAISKKTKLSPTTQGLANKLKALLESTKAVSELGTKCLIDPIVDPNTFIEILRTAYAVKRFEATFVGPNPFDADEFFQKPMSVYLREAKGEKGKTIIEGKDLDSQVLVDVSKSVASIGNKASAKVLEHEGRKSRTIHLGTNYKRFHVDEDKFDKYETVIEIRHIYHEIRE